MISLSYSGIEAFNACNYKFFLACIKKIKPDIKGNIYTVFGRSIHQCIAEFYEGKDFSSIDVLLKNWPKYFDEEFKRAELNEKDKKIDEFKKKGKESLSKFYLRQERDKLLTPAFLIEERLVLQTPDFHSLGVLDIVFKNKEYLITDFKTSSKTKTQKQIDKDLQLTIYAFLFSKKYGVIPRLCLHYVCLDKKLYTTRDEQDLLSFEKYLKDFTTMISDPNMDFLPNLNHCSYCDFRKNCDEFSKNRIALI